VADTSSSQTVVFAAAFRAIANAVPRAANEAPDLTAVGAAVARARHRRDDSAPLIFDDSLAPALCGPEIDSMIDAVTELLGPNPAFVVRSRYCEDRVFAARQRGVRQYVILGAGLDTFAYRYAGNLHGLFVFEVDQPSMQAWKRQRVRDVGFPIPPELTYIPIDFETQRLDDVLIAGGVRQDQPTLFSWLAVTQYLTRDAIQSTLRTLATWPTGSEVVLTYVLPVEQWGADAPRLLAVLGAANARGITWHSLLTPDEMASLTLACGFARVEHFGPDEMDAAYFRDRDHTLRPYNPERILTAIRG
jgi:methyltransferase (TIGR00027 family)